MINTRKANEGDIEAIQQLMNALNEFRSATFLTENTEFHERTKAYGKISNQQLSDHLVFVAEKEDSGEIIGYVEGSVHTRDNHTFSKLGYIDELFVKDQSRGMGVSSSLLAFLEECFVAMGCDHMTTHTDAENEKAKSFYEKMGFKPVTVELWKKL